LPLCRQDYLARLSGPLLDRFDIRIDVPPVSLAMMIDDQKGEASDTIAARVGAARARQMQRQNCLNARLDGDQLRDHARPDAAGQKILDHLVQSSTMTARGFNRILRVARTLADLSSRETLGESDIATAMAWRRLASIAQV
jgi:magnesium chelatase family protein